MIDYNNLFHVGIRVPNLDEAMDELGASMGVTWAAKRENPAQTLWSSEHGLQELHLKFVYSAEGPQHIELLEGPPDTFWDGRGCTGAHHVGLWTDDVSTETATLVDRGWRLLGAQRDPSDGNGYGVFSYVQPPTGLIVELVDRAVLPHFEQWWAGGD
jgi:catechol 2,3-dioxygenase-like lactoylglutathione lyase family enzyme